MAIALHDPSSVRNKDVLKMDKSDLRDFAETKRKKLPARKGSKLKRRMTGK